MTGGGTREGSKGCCYETQTTQACCSAGAGMQSSKRGSFAGRSAMRCAKGMLLAVWRQGEEVAEQEDKQTWWEGCSRAASKHSCMCTQCSTMFKPQTLRCSPRREGMMDRRCAPHQTDVPGSGATSKRYLAEAS